MEESSEFEQVYQRLLPRARRYLRCRLPPDAVDDCLAEAFVVVWQHMRRGGWVSSTWFRQVLRNKVGDNYRARRPHLVGLAADVEPLMASREAASNGHDELLAALDGLPTGMRQTVELTYWYGLTSDEAAGALGVTPEAVRQRLVRARCALRSALSSKAPI